MKNYRDSRCVDREIKQITPPRLRTGLLNVVCIPVEQHYDGIPIGQKKKKNHNGYQRENKLPSLAGRVSYLISNKRKQTFQQHKSIAQKTAAVSAPEAV